MGKGKDDDNTENEQDSGQDDSEEEEQDDTGDDDDDDAEDDADKGKGERKFTQAQVDEMIKKRLNRDRRKRKQGDRKDRQKGRDDDGDDDEDDKGRKSDDDVEARIEARLLKAEARNVARDLKVKPGRINAVLRLADLEGIDSDDEDAIRDALEEVLEETPEFRQGDEPDVRPKSKKSGRDDSTDKKGPRTWTRAEIAKLTPAEYEKHRDEIMEALEKGTVKS